MRAIRYDQESLSSGAWVSRSKSAREPVFVKGKNRILVARTDRLGDVILALPTLQFLRQTLSEHEIDFLCPPGVQSVLSPFFEDQGINIVTDDAAPISDWMRRFKQREYSAALFLFARAWVAAAAWWSGVPWRIGSYSQIFSLGFWNAGLRQRRSRALKNEAEYNLELARLMVRKAFGVTGPTYLAPIELSADEKSVALAKEALAGQGLSLESEYVAVHPGMGGSALNPSVESYVSLIRGLRKFSSAPILVTAGPSDYDRKMVSEIAVKERDLAVLSELSLPVVREIFRRALLVVAPSTGPLHLAHYVGTPTIGLYSPVRSHRKERWAPWGGAGDSTVLSPDVDCPATRDCLGETCMHYPCVDRMFRGSLLSQTESALKEACRGNDGL